MSIKSMKQDFIHKVSAKIRVLPDGIDHFRVFTPLPIRGRAKYRLERYEEAIVDFKAAELSTRDHPIRI